MDTLLRLSVPPQYRLLELNRREFIERETCWSFTWAEISSDVPDYVNVLTLTFLLAAVVVMQEFSIGASGRETIFIVLHDWDEKTHTHTHTLSEWTHWPVVGGAQFGPFTYWESTVDAYCSTGEGPGRTKEAVDHLCESTGPCAVTTDASRERTKAEESGCCRSLNEFRRCLNIPVSRFTPFWLTFTATRTSTHSCLSGARLCSQHQRSRRSISAACPPACTGCPETSPSLPASPADCDPSVGYICKLIGFQSREEWHFISILVICL